jgi:hypothetical protein
MRILDVLCVTGVLAGAIGHAHAEAPPAAPPAPVAQREHTAVIGTNFPLLWGDTFAASVYVAVLKRHAIRANLATYKNHGSYASDLVNGLSGGDIAGHKGQITDVGIGWVYYPEARWKGLMLEAGALRRERHITVFDGDASPERLDTDSTTYAARGMLGWSLPVFQSVLIMAAGGISVGYETGTERGQYDATGMTVVTKVSHVDTVAEGYLRFCLAFDL